MNGLHCRMTRLEALARKRWLRAVLAQVPKGSDGNVIQFQVRRCRALETDPLPSVTRES